MLIGVHKDRQNKASLQHIFIGEGSQGLKALHNHSHDLIALGPWIVDGNVLIKKTEHMSIKCMLLVVWVRPFGYENDPREDPFKGPACLVDCWALLQA